MFRPVWRSRKDSITISRARERCRGDRTDAHHPGLFFAIARCSHRGAVSARSGEIPTGYNGKAHTRLARFQNEYYSRLGSYRPALSEAACVSSPARAATAASASSASWSPRASPHPATARAPATEPWAAKRLEPSPATEPFAATPASSQPAATSAWARLYPGTRRPPTVRVSLGAVWDRPTCRTPPWAPAYSRNPATAAGLCPCSGPSRARLFWRRLIPCPRRPSRERPCSTRAGNAAWAGTSWTPHARAARWTARARPWVPWAAVD